MKKSSKKKVISFYKKLHSQRCCFTFLEMKVMLCRKKKGTVLKESAM